MALSFLKSSAKKRDHIVAVDLGARTTKAVYLQRKGETYALANYTLLDAPIYEKSLSADLLAEHLKTISQSLGARTKQVILALGVSDAIVRQTELPMVGLPDMRLMVKLNTKNYLQQDLPGHIFDCFILPPRSVPKPAEGEKEKRTGPQKFKVLVGGAKQQLVDDLQTAIKGAGLIPDMIVPGLVGPANACELAMPEVFQKEVLAMVEIGFKSSSICILAEGELVLSRVVGIGGDKMTAGLAEARGITYAEAEGIKVGLPEEVQQDLEPLLIPLGRELRASIDFFEHQADKTVGQIFVSGAAARSSFIVQSLQNELMVPCKTWNPAATLQLALPPQQLAEVEQSAPMLAVAIGAAAGAM